MTEVELFFDKLAANWADFQEATPEVIRSLLDRLDIKKDDSLLDIACGPGTISGLLKEYTSNKIVAIDISGKMIEEAKRIYKDESQIEFRREDLFDVKEKYDYAIIYNAYPHFMDVAALNSKLADILQENGRFAIVHSLGREELDRHHSNAASKVSRHLNKPSKEAKMFTNFDILVAEESDRHYLIIGKKR